MNKIPSKIVEALTEIHEFCIKQTCDYCPLYVQEEDSYHGGCIGSVYSPDQWQEHLERTGQEL